MQRVTEDGDELPLPPTTAVEPIVPAAAEPEAPTLPEEPR